MKKKKGAALAALVFSAAMNMNGCVYGPPPDSIMEAEKPDSISTVSEESTQADDSIAENSSGAETE